MEALLNPVYLGDTGDAGISRINLAESGLSSIQSITLEDDNVISGGTGAASGFDLDLIKVSTTLVNSAAQVAALPSLNVFTFSDANVTFQPGFLQPYQFGDPASWNQNRLFGTIGSNINFSTATLGVLDGANNTGVGGLSIGEGGRITFTLNSAISPTGLYLYIADVGGGNDNFRLRVSSEAKPTFQPGLSLTGTAGDDVIDLAQGVNEPIGRGDDKISGGFGRDTISAGLGNDILNGDGDGDILNGGVGNDTCQGFDGDDLLNGGIDKDTLTGGLGFDQFVFDIGVRFNKTIGIDVITDFTRGQDKAVLDRSTFKRIKGFTLKRSDFAVVKNLGQAKESDALITYIRKSGALIYNENRGDRGLGRGGQFADLSNGLNLSVSDFSIVL